MSRLQFCPPSGSRSRIDRSWPRIYGQLVATGEIFELHRGEISHRDSFASAHDQFGPGWIIWRESRAGHLADSHREAIA